MQGVLTHRVPEVVGPAAHDLIEPDQHVPGILLRRPVGQGTDLGLQRPDRPVRDEGVDVPLVVPYLRRHWMWNPKKSNPSLMCTIWVLAADSTRPSGASTTATSSRRASTSARVPCTSTTKSSAYADRRIMPRLVR